MPGRETLHERFAKKLPAGISEALGSSWNTLLVLAGNGRRAESRLVPLLPVRRNTRSVESTSSL